MKYDVQQIKEAAAGRWPEIITSIGNVSLDILDGRHHPCPKCNGVDRFRAFDDFDQTGGARCNQCHSDKCGDGLATLRWLLDCSFPKALELVAGHLGIGPIVNGHSVDIMAVVARMKGITVDSLKVYGAVEAERDGTPVVRLPVYAATGESHSHFDIGSTGKLAKGMLPKGPGSSGMFFPGRLPESGEQWIVCEGPKDACAYHALGLRAAGTPGDQLAVKFARLFRGCHVILMPDRKTDAEHKARKSAARLHGVASSVRIGNLPLPIDGDEGDDARDVLAKRDGEQLLRQALEDAVVWEPPGDGGKGDGFDRGVIKELADEIGKSDCFAQDEAGNVYRYNDGAYRTRGAEFIKRRVKQILETWNRTKEWSPRVADAVVEYVRVDSPLLWTTPADDVINVQNGLLRLSDRKLLPHSHEHLSSIQLPVVFDPKATCPATDKFDSEVFPSDAVILSHEIAAWLICPGLKIQKALLLLGEGGNGKSRKLNQYKAFIGSPNCAAVSLHDLESNRFAAARLFGKLANICPDLPSAHLAGTSRFKAVTGGDEITAEFKFKTSFEFACHARLIFSANHPPQSDDGSEAFFDRWTVIPFNGRFRGTDAEIPEAELDALLTSPSELSGLLNHALATLEQLRRTARFSAPKSVVDAHAEFYAATDPFAVWLDHYTIDDPDAVVPIATLRAVYGAECERRGRPTPTKSSFGRQMKQLRPAVDDKQRTVNGRLQWCYIGIGLSQGGNEDFTTFTDFTDLPSYKSRETDSCGTGGREEGNGEGNIKREYRVKPVNSVNGNDCSHTWQDTSESDGRTRRFCTKCYKFGGFVLADGNVTTELPT